MKTQLSKILIALLLTGGLLLTGCGRRTPDYSRTGYYFNTMVTLTLYSGGSEAALDRAFALCAEYEKLFSRTDPSGALYALNHAGGEVVSLPPELQSVLQTACTFAEETDGLFDPTVAPLSDLWDFGSGGRLPSAEEIAAALPHVGYTNILFTDTGASLQNGAMVDLGGIAKGYISDQLRSCLLENGVTSGLINLGGNISCIGGRPDGGHFTIGVKNPQDTSALSAVIEISDWTVATSGGYERCFTEGGKVYHHILNPGTGYPAESDLASATVLCRDGEMADALSTVCFLYGREAAVALIESLPETEALLITTSGEVICTSGFGGEGISVTIR